MIIVTGRVQTDGANRAAIEAECVSHSRRSRTEPGCLAHNCHYDIEQPDLLVVLERWADAGALLTHFALQETRDFAKAIGSLSRKAPEMHIYISKEASPAALATGAQ
ncbi:quinol monooxygenase YgiN [Novosphingobium hassiacum]|uniref:Quinol monooxygenase YgiN n=1 Tax=Novosphingobium hassiacum TaxID=173676 RepID=A0A7W5ZUG4_9SPHN|nr:putative quinol monooxygenase [Novosphingobium hassiacum]MBB3860181.1 quinol monooxygenase YgiN [Novosphingobium hassiacum]